MYCSVARTTTYDDGNTTVIVTKCSLEPDNHPDNVDNHRPVDVDPDNHP